MPTSAHNKNISTFFVCTKKVTKKCTSLLFYEKKEAKKSQELIICERIEAL